MKRFTCSQVVATVFVLGWATCPMVFAVERGKQEGQRVVREVVSRLVGAEQADSLIGQLGQMNFGPLVSNGGDSVLVLEWPDGTYEFDNLARDAEGNMSGHVTVYDGTEKIADYDIGNIAIPDSNRIDFSVAVSTPDGNWTERGTLVGVQSEPGMALASMSEDDGDSQLLLVNFSGLDTSNPQVASSSPLVVSSFPTSSETGGVASGTACLITACVGTILVVAIVVAIICWFVVPGLGGSCW